MTYSATPAPIRIGQIVPSSNTTMETEIPAMLRAREAVRPARFTFHASRMRMHRVTPDELAAIESAQAMLGVPVTSTSVCTTRKMLDLLKLEPVAQDCGALLASAEGRTSPLGAG